MIITNYAIAVGNNRVTNTMVFPATMSVCGLSFRTGSDKRLWQYLDSKQE